MIITRVTAGENPAFRPQLPELEEGGEELETVILLMKKCWAEQPDARPSMDTVKKKIRGLNKGGLISFNYHLANHLTVGLHTLSNCFAV